MPHVFVDTAHHIAILNRDDPLHESATRVAAELSERRAIQFVTTTIVLAELLAAASRSRRLRALAASYVAALQSEPRVSVVDLTRDLFDRGLALYGARPDKRYSLTDCVSMIVCRDLAITDVLTTDRDFEHEGLARLLTPVND